MLISPESSTLKKVVGIVLTFAIIIGAYLFLQKDKAEVYTAHQTTQRTNSNKATINSNPSTINSNEEEKPIPNEFALKVPFTAQAPTVNWDELHNQACEEASAIMVNAYFNDIHALPPATVEKEINLLTKWQQDNFGYNLSISTEETKQMIESNFNLKAEITGIDEQKIKQALVNNKLVILPANGQMLNNPNFKTPGPIYHMLVITGYDGHTFITNDPGTRKGLDYEYDYSTLESSNGNWNKQIEEVNLDDKKIIIISKN